MLADVRMPGGGIPAAAQEIRASCPSVVIVALTAHRFGPPSPNLERAGVIGPRAKGLVLSDLLTVIASAVADRTFHS